MNKRINIDFSPRSHPQTHTRTHTRNSHPDADEDNIDEEDTHTHTHTTHTPEEGTNNGGRAHFLPSYLRKPSMPSRN